MNKAQRTAFEILAAMPKWQRDYADWCIDEKTKMESYKMEKLPTKKEVTERLQAACDVINEYVYGRLYVNVGYANDLVVILEDRDNTSRSIGHAVYRPEPKPPERLAAVLGMGGGWYVSSGKFDKFGDLECLDTGALNCWYCPSTGEHSEVWLDEWTPEEFRK